MKNKCGHLSAFPGRTSAIHVTRRFNASSAGKNPWGWTYAETHSQRHPTFPLKPEAKKTAPASRCLTASLARHSIFLCFFLASASATQAAITTSDIGTYSLGTSGNSVDGFDCVTAYEVEEGPAQVCGNPPNPWNDLDEIALPSDDKAVIPSRYNQETPHFTGTTVDPIALRQPGFVPAFLFPAHSTDSLSQHLHERAPPSLT